MSSIIQTQQAVSDITRMIIGRQFERELSGSDRPADPDAIKAATQLYRSFLLDPRGAFRETRTPRNVFAIRQFQYCLLQCSATPEGPAELEAAAQLVDLLLSIARANGISQSTIQEDRQAQRFNLDDKYSHYQDLIPDGDPKPASEQQGSYNAVLGKFTAATEETGSLHGLSHHPSLKFIMAWLNFKVGRLGNLQSAVKLFTEAAGNPVLRISCMLLRGLCLFHLNQDTVAQQELEAGLKQQTESKDALKAEDSLIIAAHSALALIWNSKASSAEGAPPAAPEAAGLVEGQISTVVAQELCEALEHYKLANDIACPHAQNLTPLTSINSYCVRLLSKARAALSEHLPDDSLVKAHNDLKSLAGSSAPWMTLRATSFFSGFSRLQPLYEYDSMAVILQAEQEGTGRQGSVSAEWAATGGEDVVEMDDIPCTGYSSCCQGCGKQEHPPEAKLMRCSQCRVYRYCSTKCQRGDWPTHKSLCKELRS